MPIHANMSDNASSRAVTLGVITVGTAVSGLLLSMFSQPDHSLVDTGVSLVQYAGAHVVAASMAERAAIHLEAGRPGASEAFKQSRVGQVLGKMSSGSLAFSVMTAAVALPGALLSRPLIQDPTNPANWAMGVLSAAALAATIGVLNVARGNDEHITHAARRPPPPPGSITREPLPGFSGMLNPCLPRPPPHPSSKTWSRASAPPKSPCACSCTARL